MLPRYLCTAKQLTSGGLPFVLIKIIFRLLLRDFDIIKAMGSKPRVSSKIIVGKSRTNKKKL